MRKIFISIIINEKLVKYLLISPEHVVFVLLDLEYELLYAKYSISLMHHSTESYSIPQLHL